jgi:hypothetical protein
VGYKLYREVRDFAPAKWTASMRLVALMIMEYSAEAEAEGSALILTAIAALGPVAEPETALD